MSETTTPTPAEAPARVDVYGVFQDIDLGIFTYPTREIAEHRLRREIADGIDEGRIVHLTELRPGDLHVPAEQRAAAMERAAEALHEWERMGDREIVEWAKQGERRRNYCRQRVIAIYGALAALARPSGEEGVDLRAQLAACQKMVQMVQASEARRTEERDAAEHALARLEALAVDAQGVTIRRAGDGTLHVTTGQPPVYATTHVAPTLREVFDVERPTTAALPSRPSGADATEVGR